MMTTHIVVGVDGSRCSRSALRWAAAEAARRRVALHVVCAYELRWLSGWLSQHREVETAAREQADTVLAEAGTEAKSVAQDLTVTTLSGSGSPAKVLLDAAADAFMVVVGSRGHGGFASLVLGSTSQQVATHATAPAVVVRGRADTAAGPVVVGVDGLEPSEHALGVAFQEADERGCALVAIRSVPGPSTPPWSTDVPPVVPETDAARQRERAALDESLARWREKYPAVPVEPAVTTSPATAALTTASASGQLVVVGASTHGGLAGTLLGSVSLHLLHHADCPVLVARPPARR